MKQIFYENEVQGEILTNVDDSDLSLLIENETHRSIILEGVLKYLESQSQVVKMEKKDRVAMRMEEWRMDNGDE